MNCEPDLIILLTISVFVIAVLYSMVGHGGASGYIAVMSIAGLSASSIRPSALILNIIVASVASFSFIRAGQFNLRLFLSLAAASIPASYIGGSIVIPDHQYRVLIGLALFFATIRLFVSAKGRETTVSSPYLPFVLLAGAVIGFFSGLTGVGGGIFLSPLLLLLGWSGTREASGIAALFILCNSAAGLFGHLSHSMQLPVFLPWLALAAATGGMIGSFLGSFRMPVRVILNVLAAVLLVASCKLVLL